MAQRHQDHQQYPGAEGVFMFIGCLFLLNVNAEITLEPTFLPGSPGVPGDPLGPGRPLSPCAELGNRQEAQKKGKQFQELCKG